MNKGTLFLSILLFSLNCFASDRVSTSAPYLPGNIEDGGYSGREAEIANSIFKCMGVKPKYDIQPFFRHIKSFNDSTSQEFKIALCVPQGQKMRGYSSLTYVKYHNGALVRTEDFPNGIKGIEDLKGKEAVTFVDGETMLKGVAAFKNQFSNYVESSDQMNHVRMLLKKRVDTVFSDGLIFMTHYNRLIQMDPSFKTSVRFYPIFGPLQFKAVFKDEKMRDQFNACYRKLAADGTLNKIEIKYTKGFEKTLGDAYFKPLLH